MAVVPAPLVLLEPVLPVDVDEDVLADVSVGLLPVEGIDEVVDEVVVSLGVGNGDGDGDVVVSLAVEDGDGSEVVVVVDGAVVVVVVVVVVEPDERP